MGVAPIQEGVLDDWERMIDTNVKGLLYITRAVAPLMIARNTGHIVNLASIAGKEVYPGGNVYCATTCCGCLVQGYADRYAETSY